MNKNAGYKIALPNTRDEINALALKKKMLIKDLRK
jgi:hypothetical protein